MRTSVLLRGGAKRKIIELMRDCDRMMWAVAWATENDVAAEAFKRRDKIDHAVIGTHYYHTAPQILEKFAGVSSVRVKTPQGDLFHPKVYMFFKSDTVHAMVGSHNMTGAAFGGRNVEASILLEGTMTDAPLAKLAEFIRSEWRDGESISENFLYAYRGQYENSRRHNATLERFVPMKKPEWRKSANDQAARNIQADLDWPAFVKAVKADEYHGFERRIKILDLARGWLKAKPFKDIDLNARKKIAGFFSSPDMTQKDGVEWGWFGSMRGAGTFMNLVNESPAGLSRAMDEIPFVGVIEKEHYDAFVRRFLSAFEGAPRSGKIGTATRLLAMKRPDYFVGFNDANKLRICKAFGVPRNVSLENYWERIIVPIQCSAWWRHPRPSGGIERKIWDGRAALLDSIYYEPT